MHKIETAEGLVRRVLADNCLDQDCPLSTLVKDLEVDSLELVEMMMDIEEMIGKEIPDEEISKILTVGDMVKVVEQCLKS